mgnify:CR=1 FL=1
MVWATIHFIKAIPVNRLPTLAVDADPTSPVELKARGPLPLWQLQPPNIFNVPFNPTFTLLAAGSVTTCWQDVTSDKWVLQIV